MLNIKPENFLLFHRYALYPENVKNKTPFNNDAHIAYRGLIARLGYGRECML